MFDLIKRNPSNSLFKSDFFKKSDGLFGSEFNDMFDEFSKTFFGARNDYLIEDKGDGMVDYLFEVPGYNKDNLKVELSNGTLTITGERDIAGTKHTLLKKFTVNDVDKIKASVADGILRLTVDYKKVAVPEAQIINIE